jgi:hypothetical protein
MLNVRVVDPRTHDPFDWEPPIQLHPPHEFPPLMSMACADAAELMESAVQIAAAQTAAFLEALGKSDLLG